MGFIADIFYFIVVIAVLVTIHELGHFIAARLTGMRAEIFSVGMGKRLFGYNKINGFTTGKLNESIELGDRTDYRLSLLPIGGYVKISGMIDESFDSEFVGSEPKDYEFRAKNTWQKAFVLSAGVIMNILLAIFVFAGIPYFYGEEVFSVNQISYVKDDSIGSAIGLKNGDKVLSINGEKVTNWADMLQSLTIDDIGEERVVKVLRSNKEITLNVQGASVLKMLANKKEVGIDPINLKTFFVDVPDKMPAASAGLKARDTVVSINGEQILSYSHFMDLVSNNKGKELTVKVKRDNDFIETQVTPNSDGKIGVVISHYYSGSFEKLNFSIFESLKIGIDQTLATVKLFFDSIQQIFKGNLSFKQSIGGPIMIAEQATVHAERGLISFFSFIALLSISLAIINILPFPALDGGHLIFVLIEGISRREVSTKIKLAFQQGGIIILLLFMVFVLYNDIMR